MSHQEPNTNHLRILQARSAIITGGAGFIGSYLCKQFLQEKYQVICIDNLITGQKKNIKHLIGNPSFTFIQADVSQPSIIDKLSSVVNHKLSVIILHFASPAGPNPDSPKSYLQYPIKTYLTNSIGTHYLLELAKKIKAEFLFASTSEVYGNPLEHPQKETYFGNVNTLGPRSCYDESKRFGEMATMTFAKKYNLKAKIVRIFNTYGPRMNVDDGRVIPLFISQALKNKPITIFGSGKQTRSFCYINDLIQAISAIINKAANYEVFNAGNNKEIQIIKLAELIKKLTHSSSKIIFKPLPIDDPLRRKPDLTKIKKELAWQPSINLKKGLEETILYFKEMVNN